MAARVTLTTDFGVRDPYVAAMKGVLCGICPDARILDLSHDIAPQSVEEAALFIAGAAPYFPAGTIHLVVVDPGVGSTRRPLAVRAGDQLFVYPDNGLLALFLRRHPLQDAHVIIDPRYIAPQVSATFHGRDIFAYAAGHLAAGVPLEALGPPAADLRGLHLPQPIEHEGGIRGEVIHVDRFGNLITNIPRAMIGGSEVRVPQVKAGKGAPLAILRTYSDVLHGRLLALFGSSDFLEIAVNGGSAAAELRAGVGAPVEVEWKP